MSALNMMSCVPLIRLAVPQFSLSHRSSEAVRWTARLQRRRLLQLRLMQLRPVQHQQVHTLAWAPHLNEDEEHRKTAMLQPVILPLK